MRTLTLRITTLTCGSDFDLGDFDFDLRSEFRVPDLAILTLTLRILTLTLASESNDDFDLANSDFDLQILILTL